MLHDGVGVDGSTAGGRQTRQYRRVTLGAHCIGGCQLVLHTRHLLDTSVRWRAGVPVWLSQGVAAGRICKASLPIAEDDALLPNGAQTAAIWRSWT